MVSSVNVILREYRNTNIIISPIIFIDFIISMFYVTFDIEMKFPNVRIKD